MKEFFDAAPKIIGVSSFIVLLLSVVHEWGYFYVLGWHLQTIATTYDYLTNAFLWLPASSGILVTAQALEATMTIKENRVTLNRVVLYAAAAIPILGILLYLLIGGEGISPALSVTSLIGIGAVYLLTKIIPGEWLAENSKYRFVMMLPLIVLLMLGYGITNGYSDLRKVTDIYTVDQKEKQSARQLVLLRSFEKGLLVRDAPAQRIEFIRWESINSISRVLAAEQSIGYLCLWVGVICRGNNPEPIIP